MNHDWMSQNLFRFNRNNLFFAVSFSQFYKTAKALCEIFSATGNSTREEIVAAEDPITHLAMRTAIWIDGVEELIQKNRKCYTLKDFTQEAWGRSFCVTFKLWTEEKPEAFITLWFDVANANRIEFYGHNLDAETYQTVIKNFHPSFLEALLMTSC